MFSSEGSKQVGNRSGKEFGGGFSTESRKQLVGNVAVRSTLLFVCLAASTALSQPKPAVPGSTAGLELPVILRQKVVAGKTPVGTKVQATLIMATLVSGAVIPQDAILSGEVTESVSKSTNPSKLAIRIDTAEWKNGAAPVVLEFAPKLYLTAWYYPAMMAMNQEFGTNRDGANSPGALNGGTYPGPRNTMPPSYPVPDTRDDRQSLPAPPRPESGISKHRILMKNVESTRNSEGALVLSSSHSNIKLDKTTTYVLAAGDLLPAKKETP